MAFERSDDIVLALQMATTLFSKRRYDQLAECIGDEGAAETVVEVADVLLARMRRLSTITLSPATIEEQPTSEEQS